LQGFIHLLLEAYAGERIGPHSPAEIRRMAGISGSPVLTQQYPDEMTLKLVEAIATLEGSPPDDVLYRFGIYFMNAPLLERNYLAFLEGHRDARDFLKKITGIHRTLQTSLKDAHLPELRTIDHDTNLMEIIYASPRRLCRFLLGILEGVRLRFETPMEVRELECQHRGARACRLMVRFAPVPYPNPTSDYPLLTKKPGSGPLPGYPATPSSDQLSQERLRKRDYEQDVLVLRALSGQLPSQQHLSRPIAGATQQAPPALSLFEIAKHLKISGAPGDAARFSLIQLSLTRLSVQGFVAAKLDPPARDGGNTAQGALTYGGSGVLAAQRYHITPTGQTWLQERLRQKPR
jgi:hypothetical protein